jgi:hypothetical protein
VFKNGDDCCRPLIVLAGLENELLIVESTDGVGIPAIKNIINIVAGFAMFTFHPVSLTLGQRCSER